MSFTRVSKLKKKHGITPGLAVILVGEDPASQVYVANKKKTAVKIGMNSQEFKMAENISELTVNYEEDGLLIIKVMDIEMLSKGACKTILYRYRDYDKGKQEYSQDKFTIRRYQKRNGQYLAKSKFNISSAAQAQKIIETLSKWLQEK